MNDQLRTKSIVSHLIEISFNQGHLLSIDQLILEFPLK
jgi:hypothetical protein